MGGSGCPWQGLRCLLMPGPTASRFMAYHTPLRNSQEFTAALAAARALAANITASMRRVPGTDPSFRVFPYS